jgi:hypothetical protein
MQQWQRIGVPAQIEQGDGPVALGRRIAGLDLQVSWRVGVHHMRYLGDEKRFGLECQSIDLH